MAANITIGSLSLASDGKTLTATISGGTGTGYAITDTTGLKLRKTNAGGLIYPIGSVSVSGTTLNVNGSFPFSGSDTVVFDIATNSNLTDSGADTPQGQTAVAVTNNSTKTVTTFASTNTAIKQSGYWTPTTGSRNYMAPANGARLDFGVTGTDVALVCFPQITQPYEVAINGGSYSSPSTNAGGNWSVLPLATGQADGTPYSVTCKYNNSNSPYVDQGTGATTGGTLLVAGSSPALSNPSGSWGTPYWIDSTPYTTYGAVDGVISTLAYGAHNAYKLIAGNIVRFNSASSFVAIWIDPVSAGNVELYQDGVAIASLSLSGTSIYDRYILATGLDTSGTHLYEIIPYAPAQISSSTGYIAYVELDSLATSAVAVRGGDAFYGDSISDNWAVTDARQGDQFLVGRAVGRTGMPFGYPSQNVSTYLRDNTGNIPTTVTRVWCRGGHNDALNSVTIGAVGTPGTFTGDYYTMLSNIRSRIGAGKWIICEPIFPTSAYTTTVRNNYNTALTTAVNTFISNTSDAFVLLLPSTDNWISASPSGAGDDTSDGTHPYAQGYSKIANREIPVAWGYGNTGTGYTISGPSSGTVGSPSGNFTVTIASGATFTGDQTVTMSDGGNGGTFNVTAGGGSVSGNNTGNPTVTPAANATSFTYTYTPASAGAKSLSGTNAQAWQNPSASTYTATAGAAAPFRILFPVTAPDDLLAVIFEE